MSGVSMPKIYNKKKLLEQRTESWQTEELANIRAAVMRKRMRRQTTRSNNDRLENTDQRNPYKKAVRRTKESHVESQVQ